LTLNLARNLDEMCIELHIKLCIESYVYGMANGTKPIKRDLSHVGSGGGIVDTRSQPDSKDVGSRPQFESTTK